MNLLSELEGLSGENLCSAVLRLILIRSQELRDRFVDLVSHNCPAGPIRVGSDFSCRLEVPTDDSARRGRLDLLIETSQAVMGIENKLHADFHDGQPHKYLESVKGKADALRAVRGNELQPIVVVLAPEGRQDEIMGLIAGNESLVSLSWEKALDVLGDSGLPLDSTTAELLRSLNEYVRQKIAVLPEFEQWLPHLRRRFEPQGTALQREVVTKIWQFFPDPGRRLSISTTWCGYYCCTEPPAGVRAWFGFVPRSEISSPTDNEAELIVATSFPLSFPAPAFRSIKMTQGRGFLVTPEIFSWIIQFDATWANPDTWRTQLSPLAEKYETIVKGASS